MTGRKQISQRLFKVAHAISEANDDVCEPIVVKHYMHLAPLWVEVSFL